MGQQPGKSFCSQKRILAEGKVCREKQKDGGRWCVCVVQKTELMVKHRFMLLAAKQPKFIPDEMH